MIEFKFDTNLDMAKLQSKRKNSYRAAQTQLDQDVLKDSNYFIPKAVGTLEGSGVRSSRIGMGEVVWDTPYARRLYYNPQYNFSKDKNPNARGLWFEEAKSRKKENWLENARKNYRKFFNGR